MAERSVRDAAVEVMANEAHRVECGCIGGSSCATWRAYHETMPVAIAALVASAEVREGLVRRLDVTCGEDGCTWSTHTPRCAAVAILAALGGTEAT